MRDSVIQINLFTAVKDKAVDYIALVKLRLTMMVVFSAGMGYTIVSYQAMNWNDLLIILFSGFLITGSANGINQIIERKLDALMTRTKKRPLATGRIGLTEAVVITTLMGIVGAVLLGTYLNALSAIIATSSLIVYAFIYTPLKRITRLSVLAGAISGAAPPLIGYTAATGGFSELCGLLFLVQFVWQLPHFWAVAWMLDDDYKKAGFRLLPSLVGRGPESAKYIFGSTLLLIPINVYFIAANYVGYAVGTVLILVTLNFLYQAYRLLKTEDLTDARKLMFGSFYYLPLIQILLLIGILL